MTQRAMICQNVCKQCSLHINNNKDIPIIYYKEEIYLHKVKKIIMNGDVGMAGWK